MDEEEILSRAQRVVLQKADIVPDASFADLAFQEMIITARLGDIYGKIIGVLGEEIRPLDWNMTALHSYMSLHQLLESEGVSMRDRAAVLEYAASALALGVLRILGGGNSEVGKDEGGFGERFGGAIYRHRSGDGAAVATSGIIALTLMVVYHGAHGSSRPRTLPSLCFDQG